MKITESVATLTATPAGGHRWRARLIESDAKGKQGSSGFYLREAIERDGPTTWPAGTAVFFDHPGETETYDRPERSVRDLAGKIDSTPVMETDGLWADIDFYSWAAPVVAEMAADIGLSIRASATVEESTDKTIRGPVITSLSNGLSVDLVTKAGAGGKLVSLLESARGEASEATFNDVREELERVVRSEYGTDEDRWIYVRDFDEEIVWFSVDSGDESAIWQQTYTLTDNAATLTGERIQVVIKTEYVPITTTDATEASPKPPVTPAGSSNTHESEEDNMPNLSEAEITALQETASRVQAAEEAQAAATQRAEAAEARALQAENTAQARAIIGEANAEFTALEARGLLAGIPVTEAGTLDTEAFTATVTEAGATARSNTSNVTGFGGTANDSDKDYAAEADKAVASAFGRTVKEA